jgi:hypothetical protein
MPKRKESGGIADTAAAHINKLAEPQPPGVIALALGVDAAELFPHLRALTDAGTIARHDAPPGSGRGVRFVYGPSGGKVKAPKPWPKPPAEKPRLTSQQGAHALGRQMIAQEAMAGESITPIDDSTARFAIENSGALGIAVGEVSVKLTQAEVVGLSKFLDVTKTLWSHA